MPKVTCSLRLDRDAIRAKTKFWKKVILYAVIAAVVLEIRRVLSKPYPPASRPGESPHMRTGDLRKSVGGRVVGDDRAEIYAGVAYASYLEQGTKRMKKRPFMLTTLRRLSTLFGRKWFTTRRIN